MRSLSGAIIATVLALFSSGSVVAQSLLVRWINIRPSWEMSIDTGNGQKVRQEADALLKRPDVHISPSNYNDLHAKIAILGIAARGAVLEGDWLGAISLLDQASVTAQDNYALASETLGNLRKQHETKIIEWKDLIRPQEEQLRWFKEQPGLREEQFEQVAQIESFLAEHKNAISNSEQSIRDIDEILSLLKMEKEICAKSLADWNGFLRKEQMDIQEIGSPQKYVTEKLAQVKGDTNRSRFELISYARRLLKLDPTNQSCQQFLNSLVGNNSPKSAPTPARTANRPANTTSR